MICVEATDGLTRSDIVAPNSARIASRAAETSAFDGARKLRAWVRVEQQSRPDESQWRDHIASLAWLRAMCLLRFAPAMATLASALSATVPSVEAATGGGDADTVPATPPRPTRQHSNAAAPMSPFSLSRPPPLLRSQSWTLPPVESGTFPRPPVSPLPEALAARCDPDCGDHGICRRGQNPAERQKKQPTACERAIRPVATNPAGR